MGSTTRALALPLLAVTPQMYCLTSLCYMLLVYMYVDRNFKSFLSCHLDISAPGCFLQWKDRDRRKDTITLKFPSVVGVGFEP